MNIIKRLSINQIFLQVNRKQCSSIFYEISYFILFFFEKVIKNFSFKPIFSNNAGTATRRPSEQLVQNF